MGRMIGDVRLKAKRVLIHSLKGYAVGALIMAAILITKGISNGGLERHHDPKDWLVAIASYVGYAAFWPVLIVMGILQLLGIVRMPLTLFG